MTIDTKVIAGDKFEYTITSPTYAESEGYGWHLAFRGPVLIQLEGAYEDNNVVFTASPATTALWKEGTYNYVVFVRDGGSPITDERTIESGQIEFALRADLQTRTDVRTHARKVLDAIEAVIENRASLDQKSYSINGRSLERTPIADLMSLRRYYKEQVAKENKNTTQYATKLTVRM